LGLSKTRSSGAGEERKSGEGRRGSEVVEGMVRGVRRVFGSPGK
jgi:hypothetical protein